MRAKPNRLRLVAGLGAMVVAAAACGGTSAGTPGSTGAIGDELSGAILVFAAASLTDVMAELAMDFEADRPGIDVEINVAGSSSLREQILEGAPADVFASADTTTMDQVAAAGAVAGTPRLFARNRLVIAVPIRNPALVTGLTDFADESLLLGLCAEGVPCGDFARRSLDQAGIEPSIDTDEPDVRALLGKVSSGELDAGIVYRTDILAAADTVAGVAIDDRYNVEAAYPIARLTEAPNPEAAEVFIDFVVSAGARDVLERYGFEAP